MTRKPAAIAHHDPAQAPGAATPMAMSINRPVATAGLTAELAGEPDHAGHWRRYAQLVEHIARIGSVNELSFSVANEVWQIFPYRQAYVWHQTRGQPMLHTVSGLARLGDGSPLTAWLGRLGKWLHSRLTDDPDIDPLFLVQTDLPESLHEGWAEWFPDLVYVLPVVGADRVLRGFAAYSLETAPTEQQQGFAIRAFEAYAGAWSRLAPAGASSARIRRWLVRAVPVLALAMLFIPVRLSVLAPAEIVGLDAAGVNAPMDGVIASFAVAPNQPVERDQLLYTLDDTTLRNRRMVAIRQLEIARADALAAAQKSFANEASRAELASLNGRVAERQAELALVDEMLARIDVRSPADGIAVFGDVNDWQGKPVSTGERVLLVANPDDAGLLVWLPVPDAINLEPGADVRMYLQIAPLEPLRGELFETSYQAVSSPLGVQSYRLRARFVALDAAQSARVRIGLKGTAKIYGDRATLAYYLFRRPLAALRRLTGL